MHFCLAFFSFFFIIKMHFIYFAYLNKYVDLKWISSAFASGLSYVFIFT